jgi:hypothetical protein
MMDLKQAKARLHGTTVVGGLVLLVGSVLCSTAEAIIVEIEADNYAVGTNLSNLFEGVTINTFHHNLRSVDPPTYGPVHVTDTSFRGMAPPTGTRYFGAYTNASYAVSCWSTGQCSGSLNSDFHALIVQFANPTNFFEVETFWQSDPSAIFAFSVYDASHQLVGSCNTFGTDCIGAARILNYQYGGSSYSTLQIGSLDSAPNIGTVIIGGIPTDVPVGVDTIRYNTAPTSVPPVCSGAQASPAILWSPKHQLVPIVVRGVTDPDGDAVTITVTGVTQDEPVNGQADGNTSPDAVIQAGAVSVRAERSGKGNGRVYQISFRADDGKGESCSGTVTVGVPHSQKQGVVAIDDGQIYGSTTPSVCSDAQAVPAVLWHPKHQLVPIVIKGRGVTDPDSDAVTITVTGVTQDEPVNGRADGNTSPDAVIQAGTVSVRAERLGKGNGRVYQISFRADDGKGESCSGTVTVGVPHSRKQGVVAIDDGQIYDSIIP